MAAWFFLAVLAGAALAMQASMNAQLGVLLHSPLLASCIAFSLGALVSALAVAASHREQSVAVLAANVPLWLWFGGLLSAVGVGLFYYLIPRMGLGPMMSVAMSSQLAVAVLSSHFGWFDLPERPVDAERLIGLAALGLGVYLVNGSVSHA